jgi:hypothetical protein
MYCDKATLNLNLNLNLHGKFLPRYAKIAVYSCAMVQRYKALMYACSGPK